jgi:hypothetical protein
MQINAYDLMNAKARARWGDGRIEVAAKWGKISTALAQAWPLTRIYETHIDPTVISYSQFRRQVQRRLKTGSDVSLPAPNAAPEASTPQPKRAGPTNAGHQSNLGGSFTFEAEAKPGERERIIGPPRNK